MASLFRVRRQRSPQDDEKAGGSGGKITHGRRRRLESPASPYARPSPKSTRSPLLLPSTEPPTGSPRWLLGLISGAGKLISSVFRSDSSSSPSSSSSSSAYVDSSDEDLGCRDKEEGNNVPQKFLQLYQGGNNLLLSSCMEESQAIVPINKQKLAIEQLLMQETFSRDECSRLTKIIQSRVMDSPFSEHGQDRSESEVLKLRSGSTGGSPAAGLILNQKKELTDPVTHSPGNLGALFPGSPTPLSYAPSFQSTAIFEAKKWIEDRRLASESKFDSVCGPCIVNRDMLNYDFEDEGSPADLAKSYMRSLPPWQSSPLLRNGLGTPSPSKRHHLRDDSIPLNSGHSLPSFKVFKRRYLSSRLTESPDDTMRMRMRSDEYLLVSPELKQIDSPDILEKDSPKVSMHSLKALETSGASAKPTAKVCVEDHYSNKKLALHDQNVVEAIPSSVPDKITSICVSSQPDEVIAHVKLTCESELPTISNEFSHAKLENGPISSLVPKDKMDVIGKLDAKDQGDLDHKPVVFVSSSEGPTGDMSLKAKVMAHDTKSTNQSEAAAVSSSHDNIQPPDALEVTEPNFVSDGKTDNVKDGVNGSAVDNQKGSSELNANLRPEPYEQDNLGFKPSSNGKLTLRLEEGESVLRVEADNQIPASHATECVTTDKSANCTRMRSIVPMLTEQPARNKHHKKKVVGKRRRGKGGVGKGQ